MLAKTKIFYTYCIFYIDQVYNEGVIYIHIQIYWQRNKIHQRQYKAKMKLNMYMMKKPSLLFILYIILLIQIYISPIIFARRNNNNNVEIFTHCNKAESNNNFLNAVFNTFWWQKSCRRPVLIRSSISNTSGRSSDALNSPRIRMSKYLKSFSG